MVANPYGFKAVEAYWQGGHRLGERGSQPAELKTCARQRRNGCESIIVPAMRRPEVRLFDLLAQYEKDGDKPGTANMGPFLNGLVLVLLIFLIAACSLAGASVITLLLSSGEEAPGNAFIRFLVLASQLSLTAVLIRAGAEPPISDPVTIVQALSVVAGIVFAFVLMCFPTALWLLVEGNPSFYPSLYPSLTGEADHVGGQQVGQQPLPPPDWSVALLGGFAEVVENVFSAFQGPSPPLEEYARFAIALLFPYAILPVAYSRIHSSTYQGGLDPMLVVLAVWMFLFWWFFVIFHIIEAAPYWCGINYGDCSPPERRNGSEGLWSIGWASYVLFVAAVAACRNSTRQIYSIPGALWLDCLLSLVAYPLVICQISAQEIRVTDDPQFVQVAQKEPQVPMHVQDLAADEARHVSSPLTAATAAAAALKQPERTLYASGPATDKNLYASRNSNDSFHSFSSGRGGFPGVAARDTTSRMMARLHDSAALEPGGIYGSGGGTWAVRQAADNHHMQSKDNIGNGSRSLEGLVQTQSSFPSYSSGQGGDSSETGRSMPFYGGLNDLEPGRREGSEAQGQPYTYGYVGQELDMDMGVA